MGVSRRESLTRLALNPDTGKPDLEFLIYERRIDSILKRRNMADVCAATYTLGESLRNPDAIFEGLRFEEDEPRDCSSPGWRCYACRPARRYNDKGGTYPTPEGRIFLAFVNDDRIVYNWYWSEADENGLPTNHKERFVERVY
jgi:hypothetical protein